MPHSKQHKTISFSFRKNVGWDQFCFDYPIPTCKHQWNWIWLPSGILLDFTYQLSIQHADEAEAKSPPSWWGQDEKTAILRTHFHIYFLVSQLLTFGANFTEFVLKGPFEIRPSLIQMSIIIDLKLSFYTTDTMLCETFAIFARCVCEQFPLYLVYLYLSLNYVWPCVTVRDKIDRWLFEPWYHYGKPVSG